MNRNLAHVVTILAFLGVLTSTPGFAAEEWPAKVVRIIIPFPPGGSNDILGRLVAHMLSERLGKQFIIDNRPGAGGMVGTELAVKSPPDGYTLLAVSVAYAYNPFIYKLRYDQEKALTPVASFGTGPSALAVNPSLPVKSAKELVSLAKAKPGQLNYASAGPGSFQHLSTELFKQMAKIDIVHVPFKGGGPALIDVMSGNTQMCMGSLLQMIPYKESGKLRIVATGGMKRSATLPEVPTVNESGVPGYEANNWWGIVMPAGTPEPIISRLNKEVAVIMASADMQKRLQSEGAVPMTMSPQEFGKFIKSEMNKWGKVVKEGGIKGE
jgi:tripartite-type tricarboxylate transporter receptor subunit TctC